MFSTSLFTSSLNFSPHLWVYILAFHIFHFSQSHLQSAPLTHYLKIFFLLTAPSRLVYFICFHQTVNAYGTSSAQGTLLPLILCLYLEILFLLLFPFLYFINILFKQDHFGSGFDLHVCMCVHVCVCVREKKEEIFT